VPLLDLFSIFLYVISRLSSSERNIRRDRAQQRMKEQEEAMGDHAYVDAQ
jgi:hypothetical protein